MAKYLRLGSESVAGRYRAEAGCVIAMSGSAKSEGGEVKMHMFFIFDRPVWSHELKTLMQHRYPKVDCGVFHPAQKHLTATSLRKDEKGAIIKKDDDSFFEPLASNRVFTLQGPLVTLRENITAHEKPDRAGGGAGSGTSDYAGSDWRETLSILSDRGMIEQGGFLHTTIRTLQMQYVGDRMDYEGVDAFLADADRHCACLKDRVIKMTSGIEHWSAGENRR